MPWSAGTFVRVHDWTDDEAAEENIEAVRMDAEDDSFAAGINLCVHKGGANSATEDLPMGTNKHTGVGNATARTDYLATGQFQDAGPIYFAGSGSNTITGSVSPAITSYGTGQRFYMKAPADNSSSVTVNINSVGAKALELDGEALVSGELNSAQIYLIIYDGTQFQLIRSGVDISFGCSAYLTSAQTISNATLTDVDFTAESYDVGGLHNTASVQERFVPNVDGIWRFTVYIAFDSNTVGIRQLTLNKGVGTSIAKVSVNPVDGSNTDMIATVEVYLTTSDYVKAIIYQTSGGNLQILNGAQQTSAQFSLVRKITI